MSFMSDLDLEATRLGIDKTAPDAVEQTVKALREEGDQNGR